MKLAVVFAALVALLSPVATSPAAAAKSKARTLKGQVMAAPYAAGKKVVVPVLLAQKSAKRARLRAPVGVLMLKKAKKVKVARQKARVAPALLRVGDRFRARSKVNRRAARAYYWRMGVKKFTVTKRSPTLGPAEMAALLTGMGADLARLDTGLTNLAKYVQTGFAQQGADIAGLGSQIGVLSSALAALEKRVAAIEAGLPGMEARLQSQIDALAGDLAGLQTQMDAFATSLATLEDQVAGLSGDVSSLQAQMAAVQSGLAGLQTTVTGLQGSVNAICGEAIITVC